MMLLTKVNRRRSTAIRSVSPFRASYDCSRVFLRLRSTLNHRSLTPKSRLWLYAVSRDVSYIRNIVRKIESWLFISNVRVN